MGFQCRKCQESGGKGLTDYRLEASPLASPRQPMSHVFSRGQVHQKVFGRSPRVKDSATGFYRYRRAADPSSFFRNAFDNCDRLMRTPSRVSISARSRAIVQFFLSATGSSSNGVTTRNAAVPFTGSGPGAMRAFNASTPPRAKSPRQRRTVSSRTPNASAIRGLVQPDSVNRTARALSASPDRVTPPEPTRRLADRRSLLPEICHSCRTCPNRCVKRIVRQSVGQPTGSCLGLGAAYRRKRA